MTWPFENDTSTIERKLASRSFRADRLRNLCAATAIVLTTVLFTGLFTLGRGISESAWRAGTILSGGDGHARLIDLSETEYAALCSHPLIQESAYSCKLADSVDNLTLAKQETLFRYYDETALRYLFIELDEGRAPVLANEVIADTGTLERLGVPQEIGAELTLELTVHGQKRTRKFILAGWWQNYPGVLYGTIAASKAYLDAYADELTDAFRQDRSDTGTVTGIVKFADTANVEADLETVLTDCGYSSDPNAPNYINAGVNPLYLSERKSDARGTWLALACVLTAFLLTGYLIIYNIFQISVMRDLRFYGLLKTIGATERQLHAILRRQARWLACIGIPPGACIGFALGKACLPLLAEQVSFSGDYATVSPSPGIFAAAALLSMLAVRLGVYSPERLAAKVSPIEALRGAEPAKALRGSPPKRARSGSLQARIAWGNLRRDRRRTALVVLSLSLSVTLTNLVFNFSHSVDPEHAIENLIGFDYCIGQSALLDHYRVDETNALSERFIRAVEQQRGFETGGREYGCRAEYFSASGTQTYNREEDGGYSTHLYGLDPLLLARLQVVDGELDAEKLAAGRYLLEGAYVSTRGELDESSINHAVGDRVTLSCNGRAQEFTVLAHVVANEANTYDWVGSCFFLPDRRYIEFTGIDRVMSYSFDVKPGAEPEMERFLQRYASETEPVMTYRSKSTIMAGVAEIQTAVVVVGGMMALLVGAIGVLNFINTILTGVYTRRRELAILESVGATRKQLTQLLRAEGCAYVLLSAAFAVPLSLLGVLGIVRPVCARIWFFDFHPNIWPTAILLPALFLLGAVTPYLAYRWISRQSVTERLKYGE